MNEQELDFILKSHACTQVNFDRASFEDYPKMFKAVSAWGKRQRIDELLRFTSNGTIYESSSYSISGPELNDRIQELTKEIEAEGAV